MIVLILVVLEKTQNFCRNLKLLHQESISHMFGIDGKTRCASDFYLTPPRSVNLRTILTKKISFSKIRLRVVHQTREVSKGLCGYNQLTNGVISNHFMPNEAMAPASEIVGAYSSF